MSNCTSATQRRFVRSSDRVANRTLSTSFRTIVTLVAVAALAACSKKEPCEPDYTVPEQVSTTIHASDLLARFAGRESAIELRSVGIALVES